MRKDKKANLVKFLRKINLLIEQQPYQFEGYSWAALPQSSWAAMLKVSVKTVGRLMLDAQIAKECTEVDGVKMAIVRPVVPGEVATPSERRIANTMSKIFRETTGKRPSGHSYGCLLGLAQTLPSGVQIDIFKLVLSDWSMFMVGVKCELYQLQDAGLPVKIRYYKFPSIPVIRKYHHVATECFVIEWQSTKGGLLPPESIVALAPHLWSHLKAA